MNSEHGRSWWLERATITWGGSLAVIVGRDGSWPWIFTRLVVVGIMLVALVWIVLHQRWVGAAMITAGLVGVVVGGGIGVPHLLRSDNGVLACAAMLLLLAGLALLIFGTISVLSERGIWGRSAGAVGTTLVTALVALTFVPAVMATNVPAIGLDNETPGSWGLVFENVSFETSDGVTLSGWYIPSTNGAAVVLRHGAGSTRSDVMRQAIVLAAHGYGILATDARGHGLSKGRAMDFGWYGSADISAAVSFVTEQPDVDPARIGVVGMSMGGEEAIGAAGVDSRIRAVVAEGATGRTDGDETWLSDVYGARGTLQQGMEWLRYTLTDLLTSAPKPVSLANAIQHANSTSFLLIVGGDVADEQHVASYLESSTSGDVAVWVVPGSGHTQGLVVAPADWEQRVTGFLDDHLGTSAD